MDHRSTYKNIGGKLALRYALIGSFLSMSIMTALYAQKGYPFMFEWVIDFFPSNLIAFFALLFFSLIFGEMAGKLILERKILPPLVGITCALLTLWSTTLTSSLYFFIYALLYHNANWQGALFDYMVKPIYWISIIGLIPIFILGGFFGDSVFKKGNKIKDDARI